MSEGYKALTIRINSFNLFAENLTNYTDDLISVCGMAALHVPVNETVTIEILYTMYSYIQLY